MAENFSIQTQALLTDVGATTDLKLPVSAAPGRRPGSMGLVGASVQVRLLDQTVLTLGGVGPTPTLQQVTTAGNTTNVGIVSSAAINMTGTNGTNDPTNVLTLPSTTVIPTGTSAFAGSLVYNTSNQTLYLRDGPGWIAIDTAAAATWAAVLASGATSGGTNPIVSTTDQLVFDNAIRIGQVGSLAGAVAASTIAIGPTATTAGQPGGIAIGSGASVSAGPAIAIGISAIASGINSVSLGFGANAAFAKSMAIGSGSVAPSVNVIQLGDATTDTVHGRYIATPITEGARISGAGPSGAIPNIGTFFTLPAPYDTVVYENIRPNSGFLSYVSAGSVLVTLPNSGYFTVNSLVSGGWNTGGAQTGNGYLRSRLVWGDNGVDKNINSVFNTITDNGAATTTTWAFTNSCAGFQTGAVGTQTVRVEIAVDSTLGKGFVPVQYFIEIIRIS